jgi:hypothetical protein
MRYYLSNRQLKELANGKALQIALPDPGPDVVADGGLVAWACEALAGVDAAHVRQADRESIEVFHHIQNHELSSEIGTIRLGQHYTADRLTWWVEVIVVTLCEREKPRGTYPVQWPVRYEI